jgi:hypothetical protein
MTALLSTAHSALAAGDKNTAMLALRDALKIANAAKDKPRASLIFRAMNYTRLIER